MSEHERLVTLNKKTNTGAHTDDTPAQGREVRLLCHASTLFVSELDRDGGVG